MLILHLAYEQNSIYLWGEVSFDRLRRPKPGEDGYAALPWGAKPAELRAALKETGVRNARKTNELATHIYILLPAKDGVPAPSDGILGDAPQSAGEAKLEIFRVPALPVEFAEFAAMLRMMRECGERIPAPGIILADDFKYLCRALEYAAALVQRGTYIPDMEPFLETYASQWRPVILAKYQDEFSAFAKAMPPVLCGVFLDEPQETPRRKRENAMLILEGLIDSMIRASQHGASEMGRRINSGNPHEIWIRSLIWKRAPLLQWHDEMAALYPQIRDWADSLKAVTAQPWRLFMRIEEPSTDENVWRLSWHLQSTQDPSLIIPAERVWSPGDAERAWFDHTHTNPRRYMLQILGHLASHIPVIAESLETPFPCECRLDADDLFDFLQNHVTSIIDQGIQVQLPSAWGQLSDRPRLSVRAELRDANAFVPGGQMSLDDMLDVDWSVALGGDILTQEELATLAELKTPLTNLRGRWVIIYRDEVEKITAALKKMPQKIERREALLSSLRQDYNDAPLSAVAGSPWIDSVRALLSGSAPLEEMDAPEGFCGRLRPYQAKGLAWLVRLIRLGMGACLADDMGLGKTVQTLALIKNLRVRGEKRPILLICPTSVMENWRRETEKFTPGTKTLIHHGIKRSRGNIFTDGGLEETLVISSYSLLHRDSALFSKIEWAGVILDEAQNIKNPDTYQSRAARSLKADWHIALTGTPVENHVGDMWSLMEFLMPGLMPNRARFAREILRPVQAGEKKAMDRVRRMTAPFILRRLKTDNERILHSEPRAGEPVQRSHHSAHTGARRRGGHKAQGRSPRRDNGAETDMRPPAALRQRQIRLQKPLRQNGASRRNRRRNARRGRPRAHLHAVRRDGRDTQKIPPGDVRPRGALPARRRAAREARRNGAPLPGGRERAALLHTLAQSGRHGAEPHAREPRRHVRPLVEPRRRAAGRRPRVQNRPAQQRAGTLLLLPRNARRKNRSFD